MLGPLNHLGLLVALTLTDDIRTLSLHGVVEAERPTYPASMLWRFSQQYEGLAYQFALCTER